MNQIFSHKNIWKTKAREKTPNFCLALQGSSQMIYCKNLV